GSIAAWGNNQYGQCNVPTGTSYAAISAGGWHSLAIATNGSIVAWGESTGVAPSGNDFSAIASGWYHNLALRQDGTIVAWGNNKVGQCNAPSGNDFVAVSGGGYHSLALRQNGSIVAWGDNQYGQCNAPAGNDFVAVSAGGYFSLALRQDGKIVAWGANDSGQCDAPAGTFSSISGGYEHSLAIAPATGSPVAGFSATPKSGKSPLQVQFNDTSSGTPPLSYQWNFGDGSPNVTVQNPLHTYTTGSNLTFNTVLTVANSEGTDSTACNILVNITAPDPSGTQITAPAVISTPGNYRLMNDLTNSTAETAIWIKSSDVYLNGNGHTLNGALALNTTGVLAGDPSRDLKNITVENLTITGWTPGIQITRVTDSRLQNIRVTGNQEGIRLSGSPGTAVSHCLVFDNIPLNEKGVFVGGTGINALDSPYSRILDSNISHNGWGEELPGVGGYGILSLNNTGMLVSGCVVNTNVNTGIWNQDSEDMVVVGNLFHHNSGNGGIFMTARSEAPELNSTIADNTVSESGWGIWLMMNNNTIRNNTVRDCGYGILLDTSRNATLTGNVMFDNTVNFAVDGQETENYFHRIDTSNTVNGHPVYYLVNQSGTVVDRITRAGTVYGISCQDLTVRDLALDENEYGVFLLGSDRAVIRNVTASENTNGFSIINSDNPRIETCTARANTNNGFLVQDSDGVQIRDSGSFQNTGGMESGTGIAITNCQDVLLQQVNASRNNFAGIDVEGTGRVDLSNVITNANGAVGMILGGETIQVTGCYILDNEGPGIGMLDSSNVTIWNNYFSNDENIDISKGVVTGSSWNIQKTAGNNIVNGPFFGGNYWATPDGTGWSQVTPDRGDGFCNAPFVIDANNTDYLPLHSYTPKPTFQADFAVSPVNGMAPLTVKCTDKSIGSPTHYYYNFGDGVNVTGPNPVHTYKYPGTYSITLTITKYNPATGSIMSSVATKTNVITVSKVPVVMPVAKFTASPTSGTVPLTVTFTDQSTGNPTFYTYDFGDGVNMTGANPVHTYLFPGVYNVTLTVLKNDVSNGSVVSNASVQKGLIVLNGK
ncbi:MAG: NosD domain-containing protein, partial [Methanomicrobiales archaeon]